MNYVKYRTHGDFEVLDKALEHEPTGGLYIQGSIGGESEINNGCVEDRNNNACVSPNTFCAADTACAEVI